MAVELEGRPGLSAVEPDRHGRSRRVAPRWPLDPEPISREDLRQAVGDMPALPVGLGTSIKACAVSSRRRRSTCVFRRSSLAGSTFMKLDYIAEAATSLEGRETTCQAHLAVLNVTGTKPFAPRQQSSEAEVPRSIIATSDFSGYDLSGAFTGTVKLPDGKKKGLLRS